jgi:hypothetical protein
MRARSLITNTGARPNVGATQVNSNSHHVLNYSAFKGSELEKCKLIFIFHKIERAKKLLQ